MYYICPPQSQIQLDGLEEFDDIRVNRLIDLPPQRALDLADSIVARLQGMENGAGLPARDSRLDFRETRYHDPGFIGHRERLNAIPRQ
jgi:hypothetical protein